MEGHLEVAHERASFDRGCRERRGRIDITNAPALAEKVADGSLDAWVLLAVPVHTEDQVAPTVFVIVVEGAPDVGDDAGVIHLGKNGCRSRRNLDIVSVTSGFIVTGDAMAGCIDEFGDVG